MNDRLKLKNASYQHVKNTYTYLDPYGLYSNIDIGKEKSIFSKCNKSTKKSYEEIKKKSNTYQHDTVNINK